MQSIAQIYVTKHGGMAVETGIALLLLAAGGYFTLKTRFVQVRRFVPSLLAFFHPGDGESGTNVSPFAAAATSLAALATPLKLQSVISTPLPAKPVMPPT